MRARIVLFALSTACLAPTEIVLEITTDVSCDQVGKTSIYFGGSSTPASSSSACTSGRIGDLVLVPSQSGARGDVIVEMELKGGSCPTMNCIVVRRNVGFVAHVPETLPIELTQACLNVACPNGQTCVKGTCIDARVGPTGGP
jgi:hypothetical protein